MLQQQPQLYCADRKEIYGLVEGTLQARRYQQLSKKDKGVVRRYLAKVSGRSRAQITRLVRRYCQREVVQPSKSRRQHLHHGKTRPRAVGIGELRGPDPRGRPGYLRVDTVHQGDTDTRKGLYHINAIDAVTQWQVVGCCETISETHLIPVLEAILHQFPFRIRGFHSDNGSEFLNRRVAKLLNKLLVGEFT